MKKQIKLIFPAAFAVALFALPRVNAASANATTNEPVPTATNGNSQAAMTALFGDPVIAKGKGFEIKRSELDEVMMGIKSAAAARGQTIPPGQLTQIESQLLDRLIQDQLLLQKATDADKTNGVQKAGMQMNTLLERFGSQEALERQMKATGMTVAELRSKITQENTAQAVKIRELNVTVTDAEVKQFYDNPTNLADFEQPEMVHARHILLLTMDPVTRAPLSADQQQAKRKQIDDLLKRIRGGADFAALAKQYSEDPGSKDNGGELPAFPRGQMAPEFEAAAFSLTNNQVSDVITTVYGYHIIKLLDKTPAKKLALTDKVPLSDVTVAAKIKDFLTQQKTEKLAPAYLEKLRKAADVQILDADLKAAAAAAAAAANAPDATPEK
ncbi:MAG: peptidylprolyl isomerase [Verrucomicrobiota bacterium]|jgi:peptidyl-prolyl cis-trans isomerase C